MFVKMVLSLPPRQSSCLPWWQRRPCPCPCGSCAAAAIRYYPCNALTSIIPVIVIFLSYAADVLQPQHRTAGFGFIIAAFSTGFMLGPLLGILLQPTTAALVAGGGALASITVVALAVPESRPPATATAGQETTGQLSEAACSTCHSAQKVRNCGGDCSA